MKVLILFFSLLMPWLAQAAVLPPLATTPSYQPKPYTATYSVLRNGRSLGIATVSFSATSNNQWQLTSKTIGAGIAAIAGVEIQEQSRLRWLDGKPETVEYSFSQKVAWKHKQRNVKVDAKTKRIESKDDDKIFLFDYQAGILDRHAVTVAIMQDLSQGKSGDLLYAVVDRDESQTQRYRVVGKEKIDTLLGNQNSLKVQRIRETSSGRNTTLWLGADKQFVPLRIEQQDNNGDVIEMQIKTLH